MIGDAVQANIGHEFLRKHIGHEMKFLAYAAAQFGRAETEPFWVPLQDSALVRGRTLIDFFWGSGKKSLHISSWYETGLRPTSSPANVQTWWTFISQRLVHISSGREPDDGFDRWPDRKPGEDKGEDRLKRLANLVIELVRNRANFVNDENRLLLERIATRAEEYLAQPTEERFHAMDPANL